MRYVECDMQGRVFNGHYLTWIDMAHSEAIRDMVGGYQVLIDRVSTSWSPPRSCSSGCPPISTRNWWWGVGIDPPGRTSLRSEYLIRRGDDVIAEATMIHVCVDSTTFEKREWPDWFRDEFAAVG